MIVKTLPLGNLTAIFTNFGYSEAQRMAILSTMVYLWRVNDSNYSLTEQFIKTEMDLDEVTASMFCNAALYYLNDLAVQIRELTLSGSLLRWLVTEHVIILELNNDQPNSA